MTTAAHEGRASCSSAAGGEKGGLSALCARGIYLSQLKTTVILGEMVVGDRSLGTRGQRARDREGEGGGGRGRWGIKVGGGGEEIHRWR